jgi:hypothetical protein
MYESPIEMFSVTEYAHHIDEQIESAVYEAVTKVGINVNKEELVKALQYDRHQYEKGYEDGAMERRTGEWTFCGYASERDWELGFKSFKCSVCDKTGGWKSPYCPNCGAKMEVGE